MKLHYEAFSPADDGELVAEGDLELPDDTSFPDTLEALRNDVEGKAVVNSGAQVRVVTDNDIYYTWDHK
jgi:hypothetical protein